MLKCYRQRCSVNLTTFWWPHRSRDGIDKLNFDEWRRGLIPLGFLINPQLLTDLVLSLPTTVCVGLVILFPQYEELSRNFVWA